MNETNPHRPRYHRIDGWRGYTMPGRALAGASLTGDAPDSPCPTKPVMAEIQRYRKEALRANGIRSRLRYGTSSNVFCGKVWVVAMKHEDFAKAAQLTVDWMHANRNCTDYIHDADLEKLGYFENEGDDTTELMKQIDGEITEHESQHPLD